MNGRWIISIHGFDSISRFNQRHHGSLNRSFVISTHHCYTTSPFTIPQVIRKGASTNNFEPKIVRFPSSIKDSPAFETSRAPCLQLASTTVCKQDQHCTNHHWKEMRIWPKPPSWAAGAMFLQNMGASLPIHLVSPYDSFD